jgi:inner membrane protein
MAGFGHIAIGLVSGRRHKEVIGARGWRSLFWFPVVGMLPDVDFFWVCLGVPDRGWAGHRGLTHTPFFALSCGLILAWALIKTGRNWRAMTTAVTLTMLSHGLLDGLAEEGRGIMYLWPLSDTRFHLPWRPIPDAPTGLAFFSRKGLHGFLVELAYFSPWWLYALWPRRRIRNRETVPGDRTRIVVARLEKVYAALAGK